MPFGAVGAIAEAISEGPEGSKPSYMSIAGIDPVDPSKLILPEKTFQWWPDSLEDLIEVGWSPKEIPGASHALMMWSSNGGRTINFEIQLSRYMKPLSDRTTFEKILDPFGFNSPTSQSPIDNRTWNVDIRAAIKYLRAFCYPTYQEDMGLQVYLAYPPPVSLLCVPGVGLAEDGSDTIFCVMLTCDVTYKLLFPNGVPRAANVSLSFKQIVQDPMGQGIFFRSSADLKASAFNQSGADAFDGGHTGNIGGSIPKMK